jgi:hypothetical protein
MAVLPEPHVESPPEAELEYVASQGQDLAASVEPVEGYDADLLASVLDD